MRYHASQNNVIPRFEDCTLREFCREYAAMIIYLADESHGNRCHKVEANYDSYQEKTVRPINSTIFYFFFSADYAKRTFAQMLLAAARYPNQKIRRAYLRFFARGAYSK